MSSAIRAVDTEMRNIIRNGDPLDEWARGVIGKSLQLRIPMRDPGDLARCVEILRAFTTRMEVAAKSKDSAQSIMMRVWADGRVTQGRLQSHPQGIRKKSDD